MNLKHVIKFVTHEHDAVEFFADTRNPGFTHRVVINGVAVDWHGDHVKVSRKSAAYFLAKHANNPKCQRAAAVPQKAG